MGDMTGHDEQQGQTYAPTNEVIESVRELISMMSRGGISELDLTTGDVSIRLRGQSATVSSPASGGFVMTAPAAQVTAIAEEPQGHVITSPMIGTFYSAPSPGEAPFVKIGDEVEVGQVIGIIEAMKIMNEITADESGVIMEALVQNAQPVEYGSPLFRVIPADNLE
jgi:acetyl-CoA carboxylase biotin carboxyl carrier protein